MDIADLIRSKDVREYVRASNYHFTPLDAALIIFQAVRPRAAAEREWDSTL